MIDTIRQDMESKGMNRREAENRFLIQYGMNHNKYTMETEIKLGQH